MPTELAKTAKATRIFFFGSIAFIILYVVLSQTFSLIFAYINSLKPPAETTPTVGFGKLPKPDFRSFKLTGSYPQFELDTTSGDLPPVPKKIEVYELGRSKSSYLALDRAKDVAKRLGFLTAPKSISSSLYFWEEEDRTLKMNIFSENFVLDADLSKFVLPIGEFPSIAEIEAAATDFLSSKGLLKYGYKEGTQKTTLARFENGQIVKTESLSDSNLARVDFFRTLKEGEAKEEKEWSPVVPANLGEGAVQMLAYSPTKNVGVLKLKYNNWPISRENPETYPLKPISEAWQELLDGNAAVSLLKDRTSLSLEPPPEAEFSRVIIRDVYLAYFDDEGAQKYLQPIYVFAGDGRQVSGKIYDFTAYVHAIDPAWVEE